MQMNMRCMAFLVLLCTFFIGAAAPAVRAAGEMPAVFDGADVLSDTDEKALVQKITAVDKKYGVSVVVAVEKSLGGKNATSYANEILAKYYSDSPGGAVILLLAMDTRDWTIATNEKIRAAIPVGEGTDQLADAMLPDVKGGHYADGVTAYVEKADELLAFYQENGRAMSAADEYGMAVPIAALLAGLLITFLTRRYLVGQMSNVAPALEAGAYLKPGSFRCEQEEDTYLYTDVQRVKRKKASSSSGSHASGSSGKF